MRNPSDRGHFHFLSLFLFGVHGDFIFNIFKQFDIFTIRISVASPFIRTKYNESLKSNSKQNKRIGRGIRHRAFNHTKNIIIN